MAIVHRSLRISCCCLPSMLLLLLLVISSVQWANSVYVPPGPKYPCPEEPKQIYPCVCLQGGDTGLVFYKPFLQSLSYFYARQLHSNIKLLKTGDSLQSDQFGVTFCRPKQCRCSYRSPRHCPLTNPPVINYQYSLTHTIFNSIQFKCEYLYKTNNFLFLSRRYLLLFFFKKGCTDRFFMPW